MGKAAVRRQRGQVQRLAASARRTVLENAVTGPDPAPRAMAEHRFPDMGLLNLVALPTMRWWRSHSSQSTSTGCRRPGGTGSLATAGQTASPQSGQRPVDIALNQENLPIMGCRLVAYCLPSAPPLPFRSDPDRSWLAGRRHGRCPRQGIQDAPGAGRCGPMPNGGARPASRKVVKLEFKTERHIPFDEWEVVGEDGKIWEIECEAVNGRIVEDDAHAWNQIVRD